MVRFSRLCPVRFARVTAVILAASLSCWKSAKIRATLGLIRGRPYPGAVMLAHFAFVLSAATMTSTAIASDPVFLHAAGSLRCALTEVAGAFEAASGQRVQAKYG